MWPFRAKERLPWIEEALQRTHTVALELERRIQTIEHAMGLLSENVMTAKTAEKRIVNLEQACRALSNGLQDDVARLTASLDVVRGLATGGRGGRPRNEEREAERVALQMGQYVIQAMSSPEGRAKLIQELSSAGSDTIAPNGQVKWTPQHGNGSPV